MVKCTKKQIDELRSALYWKKVPSVQRQGIHMVLLRDSGLT